MFKVTKLAVAILLAAGATNAAADIINFSFTGRLTVFMTGGETDIANFSVVRGMDWSIDPYGFQTPISADLRIDTKAGNGVSDLAFDFSFMDDPVTIYNVNLSFLENNLIAGQMHMDWSGSTANLITILWDATGLFNAINHGLQAGDRISGTNLFRDSNGDGYAESLIADVHSATPWSDSWVNYWNGVTLNQGPAPIATTEGEFGILGGPFDGIQVHLDIGSGNSLYVTSIESSEVPVPAAVWLLGSGLLGLMGLARRRAA